MTAIALPTRPSITRNTANETFVDVLWDCLGDQFDFDPYTPLGEYEQALVALAQRAVAHRNTPVYATIRQALTVYAAALAAVRNGGPEGYVSGSHED